MRFWVSMGLLMSILPLHAAAEQMQAHDLSKPELQHEHAAPHGGTLVVFGKESAHLELVLDSQEGRLTAYALDGEAEHPIRLRQETLELQIHTMDAGEGVSVPAALALSAVSNVLTGEAVGDTSEFTVQSDLLKGMTRFAASLADIDIKGQHFHNVPFRFPEGNEDEE
jgi:hypothetical protein